MPLYNSLTSMSQLGLAPKPYSTAVPGVAPPPPTGATMSVPQPMPVPPPTGATMTAPKPPPPPTGATMTVPTQPRTSTTMERTATPPPTGAAMTAPPQPQYAPPPMGGNMAMQPAPRPSQMGLTPQRGAMGGMHDWRPPPQQPMMAPPQMPQKSVEEQALNGGGVDNKQQISNFMTALHNANSGGNNSFMQGQDGQPPPQAGPLVSNVGPQATQQFNAGPAPRPMVGAEAQKIGMFNSGMFGQPQQVQDEQQKIGMLNSGMLGPARDVSAEQQKIGMLNSGALGKPVVDGTYGGAGAAGMQAMMSDETQKEKVSDATGKLTNFMSAIGAHEYKYKSPELDGQGTYTTPMAQELQKTELGKQAVIQTPRGLMVDYGRLGGVNLAAVSVVHREQQRLAAQVERLRGEMKRRKG